MDGGRDLDVKKILIEVREELGVNYVTWIKLTRTCE